ncbi:MAG: efflux RND transporter periplasmic adaptor subunit [Rhodomicrobiaceae bacterium]
MSILKKTAGQLLPIACISLALVSFYTNTSIGAQEKTSDKKSKAVTETKKPSKKALSAKAAPKGMPVDVTIVKPENIQVWNQYSGRVVAVDRAQLRPQVSGRITEIRFKDGQNVNKGDILIVIDPRPYEANLKQAQATLTTAKTQVTLAEKEYERAKSLVAKKAVSESILDTRKNNFIVAKANLLRAEAGVDTAKINIDYAFVKAPISGKVSRAEITEGNLVQAGVNAPLLTSIISNKKVYVDFEVDERTYIKTARATPEGALNKIPVRVKLSEGNNHQAGNLHSFDNQIDQSTGTIRGRALFENTKKLLLPGMSVTVKMGVSNSQNIKQIAITERAIGTDQDRKFVYVVSKKNTAEYREVTIGANIGGRRLITSGLKENDVVIVEGLARIRPNMPVAPKKKSLKTAQKYK